MVEPGQPLLSVRRQCELLGLNRSSWYYQAVPEAADNLALMRRIDEQYLRTPFFGGPLQSATATIALGVSFSTISRCGWGQN